MFSIQKLLLTLKIACLHDDKPRRFEYLDFLQFKNSRRFKNYNTMKIRLNFMIIVKIVQVMFLRYS